MQELNKIFEQAARLIIKEARDTPEDVIDTKGALGQGRHSMGVGEGRSRAEIDPAGLMKDLGVSSPSGGNDLKKCASIIEKAISNNSVLSDVFEKPTFMQKPLVFVQRSRKRGEPPVRKEMNVSIVAIPIKKDQVAYRYAVFYSALILEGAYNAGILKLKGKIKFLPEYKGAKIPMFYSISYD